MISHLETTETFKRSIRKLMVAGHGQIKENVFEYYRTKVFTPLPHHNAINDNKIKPYLDNPCHLDLPICSFLPAEPRQEICLSNSHKAQG